jgi:predicted nucleic acid-binding protein
MSQNYYLVDNNALIALTRRRLQTPFFAEHCRVTADVLQEASEHPDRRLLETLVEQTTAGVLQRVREVMTSIDVGDTRLVDLYANKGAADPGQIAAALVHVTSQVEYLLPDVWTVVSLDQAVLDTADRHHIATMRPAQLAELIDATRGAFEVNRASEGGADERAEHSHAPR